MRLKVHRIISGNLDENGYVIYHERGGECFIIDPGAPANKFISFIRAEELKPKGVLLTHHHGDHTGQADRLSDALGIPVYMNSIDAQNYRGRADRTLEDGDVIFADDEEIRVLHTPGHTKGSICLMAERSKMCFTGDTIFDTDLGRTDLADGSEEEMESSIRNVVSKWANDIEIYPGHDDGCTMKYVRKYNSEYLAVMENSNTK